MQNLLISDYILGNSYSKKYAGTFIEQIPSFIYDLNQFSFEKDKLTGDYKFPEANPTTDFFIRLANQDLSTAIFLIAFQFYMKNDLSNNIIFDNIKSSVKIDLPENFVGMLKIKGLKDSSGDKIAGVFCVVNKEENELILSYVYEKGILAHCRTHYEKINLNTHIRAIDWVVLEHLSLINSEDIKNHSDTIKDKYKGRFTELPYFEYKK